MTYNTIYTDEEYIAQGFTKEECPLIREFDELHNRYMDDEAWTNEDLNRYEELVGILRL